MALKILIPNAVRVRLLWTGPSGSVMINVLGGQVTAGLTVTQATADTLGSAIKTSLGSSGWGAHVHTSWSLANVGIRDLRTTDNVEFLDSGAAVAGTGTGDPLPGGVAFCVTLRTAKAGKAFTGRTYLGGLLESDNTSAAAIAAVATAAVAFITAIKNNMTTSTITLAIAGNNREDTVITKDTTHTDGTHTIKVRHAAARAGQVTPVTSIQARNTVWDSQRRRTAPGSVSTLFAPVAASYFAPDEITALPA